MAVKDDSGDESTKVKNSNNDAEEDNCMGRGEDRETVEAEK